MAGGRATATPTSKRKRDAADDDESTFSHPTAASSDLLSFQEGNEDSEDDEEDSDDESGDDDDQSVAGPCEYEESSELFPRCAAFDKDFIQVGQDLVSIPARVVDIVDASGCDSRRAKSCRKNADGLTQIPRADREKIALLGNTGAGKSSLLNSLLGMPKLAKSMAAGQSCTHVGTEYECPFPGQKKKLAAKVEYFNISEIQVLLRRLLKDYNAWHCDQPEGMDEDDEQELKRFAQAAFDTLKALFCDRAQMSSPGVAHDFLQAAWRDDTDVFTLFSGWCSELLEGKEADEANHIEYIDSDSQHKLLEQLEPLVFSTSRMDQPALWPLVKKVRIGITGPRILDYVVLVDLPGLDDTNKVRVDASMDIMRSCDSIWVVTKIDRAITDTTVDSLLSRYGKSYKMMVICTGIDDNVDPGLAGHLQSEGQSVGDYYLLRSRQKELEKAVKKAPRMLETRRARLEGRNKVRFRSKRRPLTEASKAKLQAQIAELEDKIQSMEVELPQVSKDRYVTLVDARNAFTKRRLKEEKLDHLQKDKTLEVFCVSNVHYSALKGARQINGPRLDAEMTGIPALRSYILQSAAPRILASVEKYVDHKFTVFMRELAMWAKSFSVEGSVELLDAVEEPQQRIADIIEAYSEDLGTEIENIITKPVISDLADLAIKANVEQNWNEQFLEGANDIVREQWSALLAKQEKLSEKLLEELSDLVRSIKQSVKEHPAHLVLPMERLEDTFEAQLRGIEQACSEQQSALRKELRNINLDLTQDRHSGYFTQALTEAYEKSKTFSGKGTKARILSTFEAHLSLEGARSPFSVMCDKLATAVSKDTHAKNRVLSQKTEDILQEIHRQFSEIVDEKIDDWAEEELRKAFKIFLKEGGAEIRRCQGRFGQDQEKVSEVSTVG